MVKKAILILEFENDFNKKFFSTDMGGSFSKRMVSGDSYTLLVEGYEDIQHILGFRQGYGATQEDYLVGQDKLMRSDSFLDPVGHSVKASFQNPKTGMVDTIASKDALGGKSNTQIVIDYNGNPVLSSYTPIIIKDIHWALLSEIDEAEVLETSQKLVLYMVIEALVSLLIVITLVHLVVKKLIKNNAIGAASIHKNQTTNPPRIAPKLFPLPPTITITQIKNVYLIGL